MLQELLLQAIDDARAKLDATTAALGYLPDIAGAEPARASALAARRTAQEELHDALAAYNRHCLMLPTLDPPVGSHLRAI